MNDLENAISRLPCPQPSEDLDRQIQAILTHDRPRPQHGRWNHVASLCATAVCAGVIGFIFGSPGPRQSSTAPTEMSREQPRVMKTVLADDQLTGLFINAPDRESLWGSGELQIETSTAP